ncbi:MAG: bacteriohemerythrin [Dissulfurimicrobium sp.]|uniref:bacteriohemerythrin n=1 Tax=Dissulfurimicrobium sp. TaxID=2022436 RepID=UPI00404A67C5
MKERIYSIHFLIPALVAIMFIATIVTISTNFFLISLHEHDAAAISLGEKESVLSQRMAKDAYLFMMRRDQNALDDLKEASALFDENFKALKDGDNKIWFSPATNEKFVSELNKLGDIWGPFYKNIKTIIDAERDSPETISALKYLDEKNVELLEQSYRVTKILGDMSHLKDTYAKIFQYITLAGGICFIIIVSFFTKRFIIIPLERVIDAIKDVGQGRFERSLSPAGPNETRELCLAFNALSSAMIGQFTTLNSQNSIIEKVKDSIEGSNNNVVKYGNEIETIARDVATFATQSMGNLDMVATATRDMSTATNEIAHSVAVTAQKANDAQSQTIAAASAIGRLSESSEKIGTIIQVISNIASQTNLLALNATIEAARAGEAGKGFAVVANEVKELAKQTAEATEEITHMIQTIQSDTTEAVRSMDSITQAISEVNDLANTIASATEEQTATVSEITQNIDQAAEGARRVKTRADNLLEHTANFAAIRRALGVSENAMATVMADIAFLMAEVSINTEIMDRLLENLPNAFKVKNAIHQHMQWKDKVIGGIIEAVPPEVETDPHRCSLGRFLDVYQPESSTIKELISKIIPIHEKLHRSVIEIQQRITSGQNESAMEYFETEVDPIFRQTMDYLYQWMSLEEREERQGEGSFKGQKRSATDATIPKKDYQDRAKNIDIQKSGEFISWGPNFSVGVSKLDEQHKKLVKMVNTIYDAVNTGKGKEVAGKVLNELVEYTAYHFKTEEDLFQKYGYPETKEHMAIHANLVKKVLDFKAKFDNGQASLDFELLNFLKNWLANHICITDKKYGPFLISKGVK